MSTYTYRQFSYRSPQDLMTGAPQRRPLIIIGCGPVGLAAAIDARLHGLPVLLFDDDDTVSVGSRAVCYAKRALEVLDRLGVGDAACAKGVSWNVGRTFFRDDEVYAFDLVPEPGHKRPGMINLQQYYLEEILVERALELGVDIRWKHKVVSVQQPDGGALLRVETPDGGFDIAADWLIVADGAKSPVRSMLGLDIDGKIFMDRFLIADVVMKAEFPPERWFWFDPPFHPNQSVLLHRQADNVWRIDFQLGWDADPDEERKPEKVIPRIKAMLGDERPFELEWISIYTFQCRRMKSFRHGRLLFVGDCAHQVSPFGARGANSGIQDTDDLIWKLKLVIGGAAPERLLDSYSVDRGYAADENILNSTRSTDYITPKSRASRQFRNAALELAKQYPFARKLVNSGRLSQPSFLVRSALNTPDTDVFAGNMVPGAPADDAPIVFDGVDGWLLDRLGGRFQILLYVDDVGHIDAQALAACRALAGGPVPVQTLIVAARAPAGKTDVSLGDVDVLVDRDGLFARRYDARNGTGYLLRPDQHVAARWRTVEVGKLRAAAARATSND